MNGLTQYEQSVLMETLKGELEVVSAHMHLPEIMERYNALAKLIEKLNGGTNSIWMDTEKKIIELLDRHWEAILETTKRLHNSGGIDPADYNHGNWGYAKVLMTSALREHTGDFYPRNTDNDRLFIQDIKNLKNF